jgi:hypothetical protein
LDFFFFFFFSDFLFSSFGDLASFSSSYLEDFASFLSFSLFLCLAPFCSAIFPRVLQRILSFQDSEENPKGRELRVNIFT